MPKFFNPSRVGRVLNRGMFLGQGDGQRALRSGLRRVIYAQLQGQKPKPPKPTA